VGPPAADPTAADPAAAIAVEGWWSSDRLLDPEAVRAAAEALEQVFAAEADVAAERAWATDRYRVSYALPLKHPLFLDLVVDGRITALARRVLGEDCVLAACNGFDVPPGSPGQPLHRDHPDDTVGRVTHLQIVCALDPFTEASGATRLVPASQGAEPGDRPAQPVLLPAGGVLAYDGALLHGASPNRSGGHRRALHLFWCRARSQPHWDFPASIPDEVAAGLSDEQRAVLGYDGRPRRFDLVNRRVLR